MEKDIISSPAFKMRLIDIGYQDLSPEELENKIRQIYLEEFYQLIDSIIVNEDQKGEIIDSMLEQTQRLKQHNLQILEDTDQQISKMVTNINDQVEDINEQQMTLTYRDNI
ncbi:hypothetical protein [Gracilibacillus salinarum]|uniref:DivIVA domain-containing protein n=1 Tax=Gracilibacillus salinarum TaxID=2932255 RepID=A0ABY4GH06_9BACI|nr:hypothetical protein [Gracilibacillus salinarum]UOQ83605.1 hypothetical protein MUN87_12650 [Gracilibacillus salinarum]